MPHQLRWSYGPVVLTRAVDPLTCGWAASGWGHSALGESVVSGFDPSGSVSGVLRSSVPETLPTVAQRRASIIATLELLHELGVAARWELLASTDRWCREQIEQAALRVTAELGCRQMIVDEADIDALALELQFGVDRKSGTPQTAIDRFSDPARNRPNVDFLRFLTVSLSRDAEQNVRRRIGDPHIGRQFRDLARRLPELSFEELMAEFNAGRRDRIGPMRAARALTPGERPSIDAMWAIDFDRVEAVDRAPAVGAGDVESLRRSVIGQATGPTGPTSAA
jgi:hypothetical protein